MLFPALATFILQATLVLGMATTFRRLLRSRLSASARYRLLYVIAACLPLLAAATFFEVQPAARPVTSEPRNAVERAFSADIASAPLESGNLIRPIQVPVKIADSLMAVWAAGFILFASRSLLARISIKRTLRRMRRCGDPAWLFALEKAVADHGVRRKIILLDGGDRPPFTAGFLGRTIVVPKADGSWSAGERKAILLHEVAHVKRGDIPRMTYIELVAAIAWCVPFMAGVMRALIEDREEACDAAAIEMGVKPSDYASIILELTATRPSLPLFGTSGMVGTTRTEMRIKRIMNRDGRRIESRRLGRAALAAILLVGFSVGGTGTLSGIFALEPTGSAGIRTINAGGQLGTAELPLSTLPTVSPLVGTWRLTQPFGRRTHPITGAAYMHVGIDLANGRTGDSVLSTIAGTVLRTGYDDNSGNYVAIGAGRLQIRFCKLQDIRVSLGDRVRIGTEIGTVGATGVATGPHLHYEIWVDGTAVDPAVLLKAGGATFAGLEEE